MKKYFGIPVFLALVLAAGPALAQVPTLDSLTEQLQAFTAQLDALKSQNSAQLVGALGANAAVTFGASPTNQNDPTAPFLLSGAFAPITLTGGLASAKGCFQIRKAIAGYVKDCDTDQKDSAFNFTGSTVVGAPQTSTPLSQLTGTLEPGTTYFFRVVSLTPNSGFRVLGNELSFTTPKATVVVPLPVPPPAPVILPTVAVTLSSNLPTNFPVNGTAGTKQVIARYLVTVKNTPVKITAAQFNFAIETTGAGSLGGGNIVDLVLSGPDTSNGSLVLTTRSSDTPVQELVKLAGSLLLPIGTHTLTLRGSPKPGFLQGQAFTVSTNPTKEFSFEPASGTTVTSSTLSNRLKISGGKLIPTITLTSPENNATLTVGKKVSVRWTTKNFGNLRVVIRIAPTEGSISRELGTFTNSGIARVTIPENLVPGTYQLSVASPEKEAVALSFVTVTVVPGKSTTTVSVIPENRTGTPALVNVPQQTLASFQIAVAGQPFAVKRIVLHPFDGGTLGNAHATDLTGLVLVNSNGTVVAGPVDVTRSGTSSASATFVFSDPVGFNTGLSQFSIRGSIPPTFVNNQSFGFDTVPAIDWTIAQGTSTNSVVNLPTTLVRLFGASARVASLSIAMSPSAPRTVIAGSNQVTMAAYALDATASGEDVRFSSMSLPLVLTSGASASHLSECKMFDGDRQLNTGNNVVTPTEKDFQLFILDQALIIAKGTAKQITIQCNLSPVARGSFSFGLANIPNTIPATGVTTANIVPLTIVPGTSAPILVTLQTGSLSISTDPSTQGDFIARGGDTGVPVGTLRLRASGEPIELQRIGLHLVSGSPQSINRVRIFDGTIQVGELSFFGNNRSGTSTLAAFPPVVIQADTDKILTLKAEFGQIGTSQSTVAGDIVQFQANSDGTTSGVGRGSGTTIRSTGTALFSKVTIQKSVPTVSLDTLPSTGMTDGKLMRFKISASPTGPVSISQLKFSLATSSVAVSSINAFAYTDPNYTQGVFGAGINGQISASNVNPVGTGTVTIKAQTSAGAPSSIQIQAGQTVFFELRGSIAGVSTASSVTTTLLGDSLRAPLAPVATVTAGGSRFIWSPNSTSTSQPTDNDWTNGLSVFGLPDAGIVQTRVR